MQMRFVARVSCMKASTESVLMRAGACTWSCVAVPGGGQGNQVKGQTRLSFMWDKRLRCWIRNAQLTPTSPDGCSSSMVHIHTPPNYLRRKSRLHGALPIGKYLHSCLIKQHGWSTPNSNINPHAAVMSTCFPRPSTMPQAPDHRPRSHWHRDTERTKRTIKSSFQTPARAHTHTHCCSTLYTHETQTLLAPS